MAEKRLTVDASARAATKRVFVIGLVQPYVDLLEPVARRRGWELLPLLHEDRFDGHDGYPVAEMVEHATQREREVGSVDGIIAYRDFPECTIIPDLAARFGVRGPSLEAMLKCEHKHWSRLEQAHVVGEHIPRVEAFDAFDPNAAARLQMPKPFWVKPVKSFASHLGFRIEDDDALARALQAIRSGVRRLSDPFSAFVARAAGAPAEVVALGPGACLAESLIGGWQCTLEGCVQGAEVTSLGVVDSIRRPGSSTFLRYQYPSKLPSAITDRMAELSARLIHRIGLDHSAFNIEYFWDEERDRIWLLEINNRIAPHHALLFDAVDGRTNFEAAIDVALGQELAPAPGGRAAMAACCFLRQYDNARVVRAPAAERVREIEREADCRIELRVQTGDELADMVEQETYSYICGLVYVTGADEREVLSRFEDVERRLDIQYERIE